MVIVSAFLYHENEMGEYIADEVPTLKLAEQPCEIMVMYVSQPQIVRYSNWRNAGTDLMLIVR